MSHHFPFQHFRSISYNADTHQNLGVAYVMFPRRHCVFAAVDDASFGSSVEYVDEIIAAIARAVRICTPATRFFDLQIDTAHADGGGNFTSGDITTPTTHGTYTYKFTGANSGAMVTSTITVQ